MPAERPAMTCLHGNSSSAVGTRSDRSQVTVDVSGTICKRVWLSKETELRPECTSRIPLMQPSRLSQSRPPHRPSNFDH